MSRTPAGAGRSGALGVVIDAPPRGAVRDGAGGLPAPAASPGSRAELTGPGAGLSVRPPSDARAMITCMSRWLGVLAVMLLFAVAASGVASGGEERVVIAAGGEPAIITFVDVDQGDGVVMKIGGKVIVSDAGEHRVENVNAALERVGATRIDVAILSHPHDDHVKNFVALLARWEVREAVLSRSDHWQGTKTNRAVIAAIKAEGLQPTFATAGQTRKWGQAQWRILNPSQGEFTGAASDAPNASVAYLLSVNGRSLLFTGDVEHAIADQIAQRLRAARRKRVDVLLATHHGSKHSVSAELLSVARPRWAVLSVGPNSFGHPHPETVDELKEVGASIWCTDANGTITATISTSGRLRWTAEGENAQPWWSANTKRHHGDCVGRG